MSREIELDLFPNRSKRSWASGVRTSESSLLGGKTDENDLTNSTRTHAHDYNTTGRADGFNYLAPSAN